MTVKKEASFIHSDKESLINPEQAIRSPSQRSFSHISEESKKESSKESEMMKKNLIEKPKQGSKPNEPTPEANPENGPEANNENMSFINSESHMAANPAASPGAKLKSAFTKIKAANAFNDILYSSRQPVP